MREPQESRQIKHVMEGELLTHAEFIHYSKPGAWSWSVDGHTDKYHFIPHSEGYWHVLCPKHDRSAGALLDSDDITLTRGEKTLNIRILKVFRLHRRSTAIIHVSDEHSE